MTLHDHAERLRALPFRTILSVRAATKPLSAAGWNVDLSRHYLDTDANAALFAFADDMRLKTAIDQLFDGEMVNPSEGRAALHWALRAKEPEHETVRDVRQSVVDAETLAQEIAWSSRKGATGERFKAVVHIGIGGSDFGPRLIADAFEDRRREDIELRYCANLDPLDLDLALKGLDPAQTLIVGVSKSFGTEETLYNLSRARDWVKASIPKGWSKHFALITANRDRALDWLDGADGLILNLPETIGGRFSIWSAGSLACSIALQSDVMEDFRAGAEAMDQHVATADIADNLAIRLALLDYWNATILGFGARALLAYSRRLRLLPAYLQQLEMESNGKSVRPDGRPVSGPTAPLLWGGEGTIGQHSYHQWLHQSPSMVPAEFILAPGETSDSDGVTGLTAHALAQAEVLANGRSLADVQADEPDLPLEIAAQKVHAGGRPSTILHAPRLNPYRLGSLIALFEHRTYLAGKLWGLNSFDQWGVERGKTMAGRLKPALRGERQASDAITAKLIAAIRS
ncbi:glucose-6-phosphate isomerase [Henriciella algicola]|uniref:Glucose-6-phosphate isomerase n=1 Tax=Henriciella algicola TaxID=1608422 RepID=A0A399RR00_9PROT|nr:glucose-6-phosphate isomerase [Henriciella algicola]RIJ33211.1 glucose-6-phosphate isomerase [Henriciella algicola]